jgi:alpha-mannosidase
MKKKELILVCNAHLDPVWLWEWEEGLAETLSTFRTAARFCDEYDEFVFCHNEAVLYKWVEIYEHDLFEKIRNLIKKGRWHIMGGWFLQPDCNLPAGESFVRQILVGKKYFMDKFGVEPKTAINFDPFGHSRGLVQILKKSGYASYLFCRPDAEWLKLPADDFIWVGYDGSEIMTHRAGMHYNSERGKAREKVEKWLAENSDRETGLLLWGIGNHGGGPSREDLEQLRKVIEENSDRDIRHVTPEMYFNVLSDKRNSLQPHEGELNPWAVGCYTSMHRVKQKHRRLENMYYSTEKMLIHAAMNGLLEYPRAQLAEAMEDLIFCEFHDILPGSSIQEVETFALRMLDHGLEIVERLRARAFFALLRGEPPAEDGEYPLFVYNPHPFTVEEAVVFEFQSPEPNFNSDVFWLPQMSDADGSIIPSQVEQESSSISNDHRKRVAFRTMLEPGRMHRFSCKIEEVKKRPKIQDTTRNPLAFRSDCREVVVNPETGFIDAYRINGIDFLKSNSFRLMVMEDDADPWGMRVRAFRDEKGVFRQMNPDKSAGFAGVSGSNLEPVRIIEDGPVRTIVEALFEYEHSFACMRYKIPKQSSEVEAEIRVYWNEKDAMLKLSIPTVFKGGRCLGQVAYGVEEYERLGEELPAQKWVGVISEDGKHGLTVTNDGTYGFDFAKGELRMSLLRSAAYAGHPVEGKKHIVPQDRFTPRIDQGEHAFRFWLQGGNASERLERIDREALVKNEQPMALVCYPQGKGDKPLPSISLSDDVVQMTALKMAEENDWIIIRLFNPTGEERQTEVRIPCFNLTIPVSLSRYEIKTLSVDRETRKVFEVDLRERRMDE